MSAISHELSGANGKGEISVGLHNKKETLRLINVGFLYNLSSQSGCSLLTKRIYALALSSFCILS